MFHGVAHAEIAARDLAAGAERYAALLGRAPERRAVVAGAQPAGVGFRLANAGLELRAVEAASGEGLVALCFAAADLDACAAALAERGIAVKPRPPAAGRRFDLPLGATRGLHLSCVESGAERTARSEPQASEVIGKRPARSEPQASEVIGLDHIVITSSDLDSARALYADLLGLRLALDRRFEARGLRILFFRLGGVTLELVGRLDAAGDPGAADAFGGLAWRVADAEFSRQRLAAAGFDVSGVRPGAKPGTRVCTVRSGTCGVPTLLIGPER